MLSTFPDKYTATAKRGPRIPERGTSQHSRKITSALTATLKGNNSGGTTYSEAEKDLFI
jgi:hypothetical protein